MSFRRTPAGLSNYREFYGVEVVIFCEGKRQLSDNDLGSIDSKFWETIFKKYAPEKRCKVICKGSKTDLLKIAEDVVSGDLTGVLVAMDRDFDRELGLNIVHRKVLYTYGYSWENCVWTRPNVEEVFTKFTLRGAVPGEVNSELDKQYRYVKFWFNRVTNMNLACRLSGVDPVVKRDEYKSLLKIKKGAAPAINVQRLRDLVKCSRLSRPLKVYRNRIKLDPLNHTFGHLVAFYSYHLVLWLYHVSGEKRAIDYDCLAISAIDVFKDSLAERSIRTQYYSTIFNEAVAA